MPSHPTQWIYNKIVGKNGQRFEMRIGCGNNSYDWSVTNPTDAIILDRLVIIDYGKTKWQRFDEDGDLVAPERTFKIRDQYKFSGKDGSGTPIAEVNLATSKTSLLPFIFNDNSGATIYHVWLSQLNGDGSLKEIYFYGQFQVNMIDGSVFQITNPMTVNEMKLQTKTLKAVTMSDVLKAHTVQELVSGSRTNGVPNGLVAGFQASDIIAPAGFNTKYKPWYYGAILNPAYGFNPASNPIQSAYPYRWLGQPDFTGSPTEFLQCGYVGDSGGGQASGDYFGWSNNMYGMPDGFHGLSYTAIINKIAQISGFTFSSSDADNVFSEYLPLFVNGSIPAGASVPFGTTGVDRYNLSQIGDPHLLDVIAVNYNVRFGVKAVIPNQLHFGGTENDGSFQTVVIDAAVGTSPTILTLHNNLNLVAGVSGQRINIYDTADRTYYMTVIDDTHVSLQDSTGAPASWTFHAGSFLNYANPSYWDFTSSATYDRTKTFGELLKIICFRFGYCIDWDIHQSGASKGLPKLLLRNMLTTAGSLPSKWKQAIQPKLLDGSGVQLRTLPKHNVAIKYAGDDTIIYCPIRFGDSINIEIHGRAKQWGREMGHAVGGQATYHDEINNGNELYNQQSDTFFKPITKTDHYSNSYLSIDFSTPSGWIPGAADFYYLDNPASPYNDSFSGAAGVYGAINFLYKGHSNNWSGFVPITYEDYGTGSGLDWDKRLPDANTIKDGINTPLDTSHFNTLAAKAIYYWNVFGHNLTIDHRSFSTAQDDSGMIRTLRPMLADSWQDEDGVVRSHLLHMIEIDDLRAIVECEFVPAPPATLTDYPLLIQGSNGSTTGGAGVSGIGGTGGGGTPLSGFIKNVPLTDTDNNITPLTDAITGQRTKGHSLTQTANLHEFGKWDGTTFTRTNGVKPLGGFFTENQDAIELRPYGTSAGNTGELRLLELAANGTNYAGFKAPDNIASNIIWILPNADGGSGQALKTNGSGVLSWVTLTTGTVTSVGLSMPGIFSVSNSPVTSSGTLTVALANEGANTIFAGPTSGGAAVPTFRALVAADIGSGVILTQPFQTGSIIPPGDTVFQGNTIQPTATNVYPLIIEAFDTSVNIFTVQDSTEQELFTVLGAGGVKVSSQLTIQPYVTGLVPLLVKGFNTASNLFEVRKSDNTLEFKITGVGAADFASSLDVHGYTNLYGGVGFLGFNAIGLDTGSSVDIGSANQVLTSGGSGAYDAWKNVISTFPSQSANLVFASPDGSSGVPSFRSLVSGDLPGFVILNPLTDARNDITPSTDTVGLRLHSTNLTTKNIVEIFNTASALTTVIDRNGSIGTSKWIGAGTQFPAVDLHVKEGVTGTIHLREENNNNIVDHVLDIVATNNAVATTIHQWATSNSKCYFIQGYIVARQTSNNNGNINKGAGGNINGVFQNIGGVLVIVGQGQGFFTNIPGAAINFVVAGTNIQLRVTGIAGDSINWSTKDFVITSL